MEEVKKSSLENQILDIQSFFNLEKGLRYFDLDKNTYKQESYSDNVKLIIFGFEGAIFDYTLLIKEGDKWNTQEQVNSEQEE